MGTFGRCPQVGDQVVVAAGVGVQYGAAGQSLDRRVHADAGADVALVGQDRQAAGGVRVERGQHQFAGGGQVVGRAGPHVGGPQGEAGRVGEHLHAAAEGVVLAGVPQVVAGFGAGGDPVGGNQGAVQAQVCRSRGVRRGRDVVQVRGVHGDHLQPFVQVAVGGGVADAGVA